MRYVGEGGREKQGGDLCVLNYFRDWGWALGGSCCERWDGRNADCAFGGMIVIDYSDT